MPKLNLVIAETDELYLENLTEFLMSNYSKRFQVYSFTSKQHLYEFLTDFDGMIDVLLINMDLFSEDLPEEKYKTLIFFSEGVSYEKIHNHYQLTKYQHGDKLIGNIINIFLDENEDDLFLNHDSKSARICGFYSSAGGTGVTTIAVSTCIRLAGKGHSVFYLNLEDMPTTGMFFKYLAGSNVQTLSNIYYYIRERNKNLHLKLEGSRCIDELYKVHYFQPPENMLEMEEMRPEELQVLIKQLRQLGHYDFILIDLSKGFSQRNLSVLEMCDDIFLVAREDTVSQLKLEYMLKELQTIERKQKLNISEKVKLVINKSREDSLAQPACEDLHGKKVLVKLPFIPSYEKSGSMYLITDANNGFCRGIGQLAGLLESCHE